MDPRIICASDHFEFDEEKHLPFKKFFEAHKDQFPMLAIIVEGWYGETRYDCFDNYQVIRIHCYTTQPRVVAVDSQESGAFTKYHYLTIPVHYQDLQYKVIKGHSTVGERQTMETILKENKLPVLVRMSCEHRHGIRVDSTPTSISSFGNLLITDTFDDHYLIMNCVDGSELKMNSITCMAMLSDELTATPITGFKYRSAKEFQEFLQRLDQQVATSGVKYDKSAGNPVILKFEKKLDLQPVIAGWEEGPAPPVPKRRQAPTQDIAEDEGGNDDYEELDPEWQFPPEIPARTQTSKTSVDNETPHQVVLPKKAEKLKKGLFSMMHIGKSKHETKSPPHPADKPDKKRAHGDDHSRETDETTNDPQKPHYINTDIGRAVVKPIQKDRTATPTPGRKTAPKTAPEDRPGIPEPSFDSEEQGVYCDVYEIPGDETCSESKPQPNRSTAGSDNLKEKIEEKDEKVTVEFTIANLEIKDIANVLEQLKLSKYVKVFQENDVDGEILSSLSVDDLVSELGMKKLEAIKLNKYVHTGHIPK